MLFLFHALMHGALGALWGCRAGAWPAPTAHRRALWLAVLSALCAPTPLCAYQVRLWPAYALHYDVDPLLSPQVYEALGLATPVVLLGGALCCAVGFWLAYGAHRVGRPVWAMAIVAALAGSAMLVWATDAARLGHIADFAGFWAGQARPAWRHTHVVLLGAAYAVAALIPLFAPRLSLWPTAAPTRA